MEIASDKKIVDYTKLKEVSSDPNAKFEGKFRHLNCCVKKKEKCPTVITGLTMSFFLHSVCKTYIFF